MEQKKSRISVLGFAALALLLCVLFFVISAAPAFARYRDEIQKGIVFEVREPEHICFGKIEEEKFVPFAEGENINWVVSEGKASLTLTVANGTSNTKYFSEDQKITIQLAAGPEFENKKVSLVFKNGEKEETINGTAAKIEEDSTFYKSFGTGVLFSFLENEEEFFYVLEGGEFSCFTFTITVETEGLENTSFLQPHVVAEVIKEN